MSIKREIQNKKRALISFFKTGSIKSHNIRAVEAGLQNSVPSSFPCALFNFMIDFELIWGNGNIGDRDHSSQRRVSAAVAQAENFKPFLKMLDDLGFNISWAILGKLSDASCIPSKESEKFTPSWVKEDWYSLKYTDMKNDLWNGVDYLNYILKNTKNDEVLSHGHSHIDYADASTTEPIAKWDMENGVKALRDFGFSVEGFVYPCNKHNFKDLLKQNNIGIIRGINNRWNIEKDLIETPIGFWISPAFFTVNEVKQLLDIAVIKKSFFHPWMHLLECDIKQNDIEDFYKPIFEYVLNLEKQGKIKNISFKDISKTITKGQ